MGKLFKIVTLLCFLAIFAATSFGLAGTYRNTSNSKKYYLKTDGNRGWCSANEECESYQDLEEIDSTIWTKTSDLPLVPVVYDRLVTSSTNSTETVTIEPSWSKVRITNLTTASDGRVTVYINSTANSYSPTLEVANSNNDRDEITLTNDYRISTLYIQFLSTSGGTVKVEEIPQ